MAIEISNIHEILKVPELKDASIQSEIFLGLINLRGITVPVVSFIRILKMEEDKSSCFEMGDKRVIIVKIGEDLVGMLVDTVECINSYYDEDLMEVPMFSKKRLGMFKGCLKLPNEKELFLIDHSEILSNKEILDVTEGHSKIYQAARVNNVLKKLNRESYISFRLDHLFGISIKDVKEIINYPEEILAAPGMPFFVKGMLNLRSNLITIIDTRSLYSMTLSNEINSEAKVLIFEKFNERFGLIVDSLESILQIDQDHKFKIPSLVTKAIENKFQSDIKEIISVPMGEKETALIILSIDSIADRIRNQKAA